MRLYIFNEKTKQEQIFYNIEEIAFHTIDKIKYIALYFKENTDEYNNFKNQGGSVLIQYLKNDYINISDETSK